MNGSSNRFSNMVAILIALVTTIGAIIAWRVAVASSDAGSADTTGLLVAVDREDATTQATLKMTLFMRFSPELAQFRPARRSNSKPRTTPCYTTYRLPSPVQAPVPSKTVNPSRRTA